MIYLDNAATTPLHPEVIKLIHEEMQTNYANPSSTHALGRQAKALVEQSRRRIAQTFNVSTGEVVFTAGGSEANNLILWNAVTQLGVKNIITSRLEHHAVLHTIEDLVNRYGIDVRFVKLDKNGAVDYEYLEQTLSHLEGKTLVSLMYVNNEIGTILDVSKVSALTGQYQALFHSDTVQGIGYYPLNLQETPIDFITASAHKFHGPKGVGFAIIKKGLPVKPLLHGGGQEHGMRAGTENTHSIAGMAKALELSREKLNESVDHMRAMKHYFVERLQELVPDIKFNGDSDKDHTAVHILNVHFPKAYPMLLFKLDMAGIACSGGSACQSGSDKGSHVLAEILSETEAQKTSVRWSFSKFTTKEDLDQTLKALTGII